MNKKHIIIEMIKSFKTFAKITLYVLFFIGLVNAFNDNLTVDEKINTLFSTVFALFGIFSLNK
jgi:hypothetical protein